MLLQLSAAAGQAGYRNGLPFDARDGGPVHVPGGVKRWPVDTAAPILFVRVGDTVETRRAAQRLSAIKMQSLNDRR
jgi:hypothetical protein